MIRGLVKESVLVAVRGHQIADGTFLQRGHNLLRQRRESILAKSHIPDHSDGVLRSDELKINLFQRLTCQVVRHEEAQRLAVRPMGDGQGLPCPFRLGGHLPVPFLEQVLSVVAHRKSDLYSVLKIETIIRIGYCLADQRPGAFGIPDELHLHLVQIAELKDNDTLFEGYVDLLLVKDLRKRLEVIHLSGDLLVDAFGIGQTLLLDLQTVGVKGFVGSLKVRGGRRAYL